MKEKIDVLRKEIRETQDKALADSPDKPAGIPAQYPAMKAKATAAVNHAKTEAEQHVHAMTVLCHSLGKMTDLGSKDTDDEELGRVYMCRLDMEHNSEGTISP